MNTTSFFGHYPSKFRPLFEAEFQGHKRPRNSTVSFQYTNSSQQKYAIYLDLEKSGLILALNYEAPTNDYFNSAFLEILSRKIAGLPIDEALNISNLDLLDFLEEETEGEKGELWDFFLQMISELLPLEYPLRPLPLFLLQNAIFEYLGPTSVWQEEEISNDDFKKNDNLICRCFGLTYAGIVPLLKENPNLTLRDVTDKTSAGGGCASCIQDIEDAIDEWREELGIMPEVDWKTYTILGQSQAEWLLILYHLIEEYIENKELSKIEGEWGIVSLKGHHLILKGPLPVDIQKDLYQFIKKKAQVLFHLSFLL